MKSLLVIGESMLELRARDEHSLHKSFAGDVYNSAIYAKRKDPTLNVGFLTGVGKDQFSQDLIANCQTHGIDSKYCLTHDSANLGIYHINTDDSGERSFTYWRKNSAASFIISLLDAQGLLDFTHVDVVYFSGISLAILSDEDKNALLCYLNKWRLQGCKIAFDPNYRPTLWHSAKHAQRYFDQCYKIADIVLPGIEDHDVLYGHKTSQEIYRHITTRENCTDCKEVIIKAGTDGVFGFDSERSLHHVPFIAAPKQVDSTAAGDSFAGTYLAARLSGANVEKAISDACHVARVVVQHSGAILGHDIDVNQYE